MEALKGAGARPLCGGGGWDGAGGDPLLGTWGRRVTSATAWPPEWGSGPPSGSLGFLVPRRGPQACSMDTEVTAYSGRGQRVGAIHAQLRDKLSPQLDLAWTWGGLRTRRAARGCSPGAAGWPPPMTPEGAKHVGAQERQKAPLSGFSL